MYQRKSFRCIVTNCSGAEGIYIRAKGNAEDQMTQLADGSAEDYRAVKSSRGQYRGANSIRRMQVVVKMRI